MPESFKDGDPRFLWQAGKESGPSSEREVLSLVDAFFPKHGGHVTLGRGHDCAVLAPASPSLALSKDLFLEDAHFVRDYFRPEEAGAKALAAAASDLAAAGAAPEAFALGLILPPDLGRSTLAGVLQGMAEEAARLKVLLAGGDIARGQKLGLSITVWGSATDGDAPFLQRGRAAPGDLIFMVGQAGLSRTGLWALQAQGRAALEKWPKACAAHLRVLPLIAEGQALARLLRDEKRQAQMTGRPEPALSLMDLSDGLAADLPRLLEPFGAELELDPDMVPEETRRAAPLMNMTPEDCFVLGGEDYALIGACPPELWPGLQKTLPGVRRLGAVRAAPGIGVNGQEFSAPGFDHFSAPGPSASLTGCAPGSPGPSAPLPERLSTFPDKSSPLPECARGAAGLLRRIGREAWQSGLMAGFNGNLSCRLRLESGPHCGLEACLITRSGSAKARLEESDFSLLAIEDGALLAGPAPSSESAVHLGIYRLCPQSRAVFHVHPPLLLAASLAFAPQERLDLPLPEAAVYSARLAWTPFFPPGSAELGRAVAEAAARQPAVWMESHGLVVHGPDPDFTLALAEELEQLARVRLASLCGQGGARTSPLSSAPSLQHPAPQPAPPSSPSSPPPPPDRSPDGNF